MEEIAAPQNSVPIVSPATTVTAPMACPFCHVQAKPTDYFCANCGKKLKEPPPSTSTVRQLAMYAVAVLLPPLGLWPAYKYMRQNDSKSKTIGSVLIGLTIVSCILSIYYAIQLTNAINAAVDQQFNSLGF